MKNGIFCYREIGKMLHTTREKLMANLMFDSRNKIFRDELSLTS
jgi:hypothetical protein